MSLCYQMGSSSTVHIFKDNIMKAIEVKTMEYALQQAQYNSPDDVVAVASMIIKITQHHQSTDAVWNRSEELLLRALISHEIKNNKDHPSFINILSLLESADLDSIVMNELYWKEFAENSSDNFKKGVISGLQTRLAHFRMLARTKS